MHYYQHHIGDFIKDTANLTNEQIAVYMKMLWRYYVNEKPFTESCEDIAFAVRSDEKTVHLLLRHFFVQTDEGWRQPRCDREIAHFHEKADKARESAKARWSNASGMRSHSDGKASATKTDANQEPRTNNQQPKKETAVAESAPCFFDEFWNAWPKHPRKVAKDQCRNKWRSKGCDGIKAQVMASLAAHKASEAWKKGDGEYIPAPLTWLNQSRWEAPTQEQAQEELSPWYEGGRKAIEAKAAELGLSGWDEVAEQWGQYRRRVFEAAGHHPARSVA